MIHFRKAVALGLCFACLASSVWAQQLSIEPVRPSVPVLWRPYSTAHVPAIRLANSGRLGDLVRAGRLYLTAQDAIAIALENNIDLEVARYGPFASMWRVTRAEAGGALPGVPSGASQAGSVASGQGVLGSQAAAGVSGGGGRITAGGGNATISQVGPVTQNLDPAIQETTTFSHATTPQPNTVQSLTSALVSNSRASTASYQQGFLTGGGVSVTYSGRYLSENSPTNLLNPSVAPNLSVAFQHNLLRGFGIAMNARNITVAKINLKTSDLNFQTQVTATVVAVLNAYYALVDDFEDVKAKQIALDVAQAFFTDNKRRVELGSLAEADLTTSESQLATSQQNLVIAQTTLQQQEISLKNLLSRTGVADPLLAKVQIVPVDRIVIPDKDDIPALPDLIQKAIANRTDLAAEKANLSTAEISLLGTKNGVLPSLQVFGAQSQRGLAGTPRQVVSGGGIVTPDPYFDGGTGTALGQIFRRNFPTERIGAFYLAQIGNRQAQADNGIDLLQLRQTQLSNQKSLNQVGVDVLNSVIALQQARVRYEAAVQNRTLAQQLAEAEQKKFTLGASTPYNVIQQQRDLTAAESAVIAALTAYGSARITLDRTLGTTLEANHISIVEAREGKVARASSLPAVLPEP
ncbi:MAG: TolC family protein [Candidatus Solibacter usitatus]|nr:TolC family protein [Candidatus Solibacter usitatus]